MAAFTLLVPRAAAQAPSPTLPPPPVVLSKAALQAKAEDVAKAHGFSAKETDEFIGTINWEDRSWDCAKQSESPNAKDGGRELSFGLAMIHLPAHPDISRAQAQDCDFALEWMAKEWDAGRQWEWTGYTLQYGK